MEELHSVHVLEYVFWFQYNEESVIKKERELPQISKSIIIIKNHHQIDFLSWDLFFS